MATLTPEYRRAWETANKDKRREYNRTYDERMRAWYRELKSSLSCKVCGENHPACLDFHHRDSEEKLGHVSHLIKNRLSKQRILDEIAKCDVLCANCHRKLHWQ